MAENTAQAGAETATQPAADADAKPDYSSLTAVDDTDKPGEAGDEQQIEQQAETVPGDTKADDGEAKPETEQPQTQQPGTPDKALQKVQQDLSATTRKLEALFDKVDSGQPLTPQEKQQAQAAKRKIEQLTEAINGNEFNAIDHGALIGETLVENDQAVQGLQQQVQTLAKTVSTLQAEKTWSSMGQRYPGIDVQEVWNNALKDAAGIIGAENPGLQNLANNFFHQRADAASKSVKAKATPKKEDAKPVTPGAGRVTLQPSVTAPEQQTDDQRQMAAYMALAKED